MKYIIYLILLCIPLTGYSRNESINDVLLRLDKRIANERRYILIKEQSIDKLKFQLNSSVNTKSRFTLSNDLFEEYRAYQYDSAYHYAVMSRNLAVDRDDIAKAECNLLLCYANVGLFKEAADVVDRFSVDGLTEATIINFYITASQMYRSMRLYPVSSKDRSKYYLQEQLRYRDLAMQLLPQSSFDYKVLSLQNEVYRHKNYQESIDTIVRMLDTPNIHKHHISMLYYALGNCYDGVGDRYNAIYYMALSAIADIESSTCQTLSAKKLSTFMYERGDLERASRYIRKAYNDVNFFNDPMRKLEIQAIMPQIESKRYDEVSQYLSFVVVALGLIVALLIGTTVLFVKIKRQNVKLRLARQELSQRAKMLESINTQLVQSNQQLDEANQIKYLHIIQSLYNDIPFVERVETVSKKMYHQIRAKQYSDLSAELARVDTRRERYRLSKAFDSAFMKLYPNFIEEYNRLFEPEHQLTLGEDEPLPAEVKIFALIRLGIEDVTQISKYLNLSANTIYVYKTRVKSRSWVANDDFENRIKLIGTEPSKIG